MNYLKGDYKKSLTKLGWRPKTRFKALAEIMVNSDLERWRRWGRGEHFPWDARTIQMRGKYYQEKLSLTDNDGHCR